MEEITVKGKAVKGYKGLDIKLGKYCLAPEVPALITLEPL